jgi:hypothetical protein
MLRVIPFLIAALTAFACRNAHARLWETKTQLDARYGKPTSTFHDADGPNYVYRFHQFQVLVTLLDGKSQSELYYHSSGNSGLTPAEIQTLLSLNAVGNSWRTTEGIFALVKPSGGHPIAVGAYRPEGNPPVLGVCTADFVHKSGAVPGNKKVPH